MGEESWCVAKIFTDSRRAYVRLCIPSPTWKILDSGKINIQAYLSKQVLITALIWTNELVIACAIDCGASSHKTSASVVRDY